MQLKALSERVRIIPGPVNIGVVLLSNDRVALIDSGIDRRSARKVLEFLADNKYQVAAILNTHAHADHIGGNCFIHEATDCAIYAGPSEVPAIQNPLIQAIALYGGFPPDELQNRFIVAEPSPAEVLVHPELKIDDLQIQVLDLPGHSIGQKGFLIDGVAFLADTLFPVEVLQKHRLIYVYNPLDHLDTLEWLKTLKASWFVGGHFPPEKKIETLIDENTRQVKTALKTLHSFLVAPQPYDRIVKDFLGRFNVKKTGWEHFLYRSTLNGYLSALKKNGEADMKVIDNLLVWFAKSKPVK